ncbi:MAG: inositol monophosphatase family protein [Spirochaetota bacterium]
MKTDSSVQKLYELSIESARKAGMFLLERFRNGSITVISDLRHDVKLDVDVEAENMIIKMIGEKYPDHGFICEESGRVLQKASRNWIIDPLDGTLNYSRGIPHFCTSIAFKNEKNYLVGCVYDPVRDEMFSAIQGEGSCLNQTPIKRRPIMRLEEAVVAGGFFKAESFKEGTRIFERLATRVKKVRFFGSAALDLCYLACGRMNGYIQYGVNEWDIAAAMLIAGNTGIRFDVVERNEKLNIIAAEDFIFEDLKRCIKL